MASGGEEQEGGRGRSHTLQAPTHLGTWTLEAGHEHQKTHLRSAVGFRQVKAFSEPVFLICEMVLANQAFGTISGYKEVLNKWQLSTSVTDTEIEDGRGRTSPTSWGQGWAGPRLADLQVRRTLPHTSMEEREGLVQRRKRAKSVHLLPRQSCSGADLLQGLEAKYPSASSLPISGAAQPSDGRGLAWSGSEGCVGTLGM